LARVKIVLLTVIVVLFKQEIVANRFRCYLIELYYYRKDCSIDVIVITPTQGEHIGYGYGYGVQ